MTPVMLGLVPLMAIAGTSELPISCPGCNLRGLDFNAAVMGEKRFIDSNFANADRRGANLS
ncbi:pentapeptide repeat-containing protein [Synechococcus sp. MIT S1220]|uniref:pentapeptide repeat-containing protein n=1 Tax=Synechococcus sp. MIT S1220 TaxID=3082549 RepID=UPI0039AFB6BD